MLLYSCLQHCISIPVVLEPVAAATRSDTAVQVGRVRCVEIYGAGEAYLPLLEVLGRLGRGLRGNQLSIALRQQVPRWLVHLPAAVRRLQLHQRIDLQKGQRADAAAESVSCGLSWRSVL